MNFFKVLFSKQEGSKLGQKKRAVAFVDFEHWYISLDKLYHIRPDIKGFRDELFIAQLRLLKDGAVG